MRDAPGCAIASRSAIRSRQGHRAWHGCCSGLSVRQDDQGPRRVGRRLRRRTRAGFSYLMELEARTLRQEFVAEDRLRAFALTCLLVSSATLFVGPAPVAAQTQASISAIPDNARPRSYGTGWNCNRGFRESVGRCVAVTVPPNAYLSPDGSSWT